MDNSGGTQDYPPRSQINNTIKKAEPPKESRSVQ